MARQGKVQDGGDAGTLPVWTDPQANQPVSTPTVEAAAPESGAIAAGEVPTTVPPDGTAGSSPAGETTMSASDIPPPAPGGTIDTAQQGAATLGKTPPAGSGEEKPDVVAPPIPPAPPVKEGKKRVNCEALKGQKVIVGNGKVVQIDKTAFLK